MQKLTTKQGIIVYTTGFMLSIALTMAAYMVVRTHTGSGHLTYAHSDLTIALMVLALVQLFVQLYFFLHLGSEARPKWNLVTFLFMVVVVLIIGVGSLWIMNNLNYNMMQGHEADSHMMHERQKGF